MSIRCNSIVFIYFDKNEEKRPKYFALLIYFWYLVLSSIVISTSMTNDSVIGPPNFFIG